MMEITYSHQARKVLKRMGRATAMTILKRIEKLAADPSRNDVDVKKLQGRDGYRLRVGNYRVIYGADGVVLSVERIGPRGDVYK